MKEYEKEISTDLYEGDNVDVVKFVFYDLQKNTSSTKYNVDIEVNIRNKIEGIVFSASGNVYYQKKYRPYKINNDKDFYSGGQVLDEIYEMVNNKHFIETRPKEFNIIQNIYDLWKRNHLNDMHAECKHQRDLGWLDSDEKITMITIVLKPEYEKILKNTKEKIVLKTIKEVEDIEISDEEKEIYNLYETYNFNKLDIDVFNSDERLKKYFQEYKSKCSDYFNREEVDCSWVIFGDGYNQNSPRGLLSKPCPTCRYKYGSGWNYKPISKEDQKLIEELFKE